MTGYEPSMIEIYMWEKGIVLRDISLIAYDRKTKKIQAVGYDAQNLTGPDTEVVSPLRNGQMAEWDTALGMLQYDIHKAYETVGKRISFKKPRIAVCMAPGASGVEKKAMEDALLMCGARKVILSDLPLEEFLEESSEKECDLIISIHSEGQ